MDTGFLVFEKRDDGTNGDAKRRVFCNYGGKAAFARVIAATTSKKSHSLKRLYCEIPTFAHGEK